MTRKKYVCSIFAPSKSFELISIRRRLCILPLDFRPAISLWNAAVCLRTIALPPSKNIHPAVVYPMQLVVKTRVCRLSRWHPRATCSGERRRDTATWLQSICFFSGLCDFNTANCEIDMLQNQAYTQRQARITLRKNRSEESACILHATERHWTRAKITRAVLSHSS